VVRHGRLAGAAVAGRGAPPWPVVDALVATADTVEPGPGPLLGAPAEEAECVLRWLEQPGARLVLTSHPWALPAFGAGGLRAFLGADSAWLAADPFADRRRLRVTNRPVRSSA
jgi:DNA polymerase III subunit epsilon